MNKINNVCECLIKLLPRVLPILIIFVLSTPITALAETNAYPFNKGRTRFSLQVGNTTAFNQNYTAIGIGGGYYVRDGLEVGLDGDAWFGMDVPGIYRLSPGLRYVLYSLDQYKPYAGIFYRRSFIEGHDDRNEAGGRAGVTVLTGWSSNLSVGLVYDVHINCDKTVYSSCSQFYTELSYGILF